MREPFRAIFGFSRSACRFRLAPERLGSESGRWPRGNTREGARNVQRRTFRIRRRRFTHRSPAQGAGVSKGAFAKIALATTVFATLANVVVYFLADLFVQYHPDFLILTDVTATVFTTAMAAVVASLVYAGLLRFTANPVRNFSIVSAVVFVVTTVPDFTYIPGVEGGSTAQAAVLALMHVVAATIITGTLTKLARPAQS